MREWDDCGEHPTDKQKKRSNFGTGFFLLPEQVHEHRTCFFFRMAEAKMLHRKSKGGENVIMRFSIRESDAAFLREGQRYKISCHNKGAAESAATGTLLGKAQDVETPENGVVNAVPLMVGKLLETTIGHLVHKTAVPQRSSERPPSPECSRSPERPPHHRDRRSTGSRRNSCHSTCGSVSPNTHEQLQPQPQPQPPPPS